MDPRSKEKHVSSLLLMLAIAYIAGIFIGDARVAFADTLKNSATQRIGNYEVQVATDPINPVAGKNTKIMLRVASIDGQELVDVPVIISMVKEGNEISESNPIFIQYGHYSYDYMFPQEGVYALKVEVTDMLGTGNPITFTFRIQAVKYDFSQFVFPVATAAVGVGAAATTIMVVKSKKGRKSK